MRAIILVLVVCFSFTVLLSLRHPATATIGVAQATESFRTNAVAFGEACKHLELAVKQLKPTDSATLKHAVLALKECRIKYKSIETFFEYFFPTSALQYNSAAKVEVEEPFMEWQEPVGLQQVESLLFEPVSDSLKRVLIDQALLLSSSASDLLSILFQFNATDVQVLESTRLALIRVYTLGITGYDAPLLKSGISESRVTITSVRDILQPYILATNGKFDNLNLLLTANIQYLTQHSNFDQFNRLHFLTEYGLPMQRQVSLLIKYLGLELNTTSTLVDYNVGDLFTPGFINIRGFTQDTSSDQHLLQAIGKQLFYDKALSGANRVSCATCHDPAKHFTDGLEKSFSLKGHSTLSRNAPTLLYSGFQHEFFWDGRAKSMEEQISSVLMDTLEMNSGNSDWLLHLATDVRYAQTFEVPGDSADAIRSQVAIAIASYVRTMNPFNSRFDLYMAGNTTTLSLNEQNGFNLFMGKAQCGTCHFAPLFNGLVPPVYNRSEVEVLGTIDSDDFSNPLPDADPGRFKIFEISYYKKAFKTPTIRNVSATGPYMHHGKFKTLKAVVEFYNKGGGRGMGLAVPNQTLLSVSLNLNDKEVADIVSFMNSLEDKLF